jgi:hypothetical protein
VSEKYRAHSISVPVDVMKLVQEVQKELEAKFGVKFSYPQVISYLVKHRSK